MVGQTIKPMRLRHQQTHSQELLQVVRLHPLLNSSQLRLLPHHFLHPLKCHYCRYHPDDGVLMGLDGVIVFLHGHHHC